ncbi:MAG TPA: CvpA family protein [Phycisphaerae bacterium]
MVLNLSVLVMVLLITLYLANQGMLSSLLALATATFSSILAMALLEPLQSLIGSFKPDYTRGCTFLLVFLLAFSITRIAADMVVVKNIKLSTLINRIAGGTVGFFTALVVVGTLVLGLEMLPLPNSILGFDRFGAPSGMQGVDTDGKAVIGEMAHPDSVWLSPDRFVLAIWNGASGRSLGGARSWDSVHPDLSVESYGYRNIVPGGSQRTLSPDLFKVAETWASSDPSELKNFGIPVDGKRAVMVRVQIKQTEKNINSFDVADSRFRASATQIRLVTDKPHQYYPVGYLEDGRKFIPITLDAGRVVDDYQKEGQDSVVYEDWVFKIEEGEKPAHVEKKQLAGADLAAVKDKPTPPLATALYPAHAWLKDLCSVVVTFDPGKGTLKSATVYVLKPEALRGDVNSMLSSAFDKADRITNDMENSANGWTKEGKPGVPSYNDVLQPFKYGRGFKNDPDSTPVTWEQLLPLMLYGEAKNNADQNLTHMPQFMTDEVVPFWQGIKGDLIIGSSKADESGRAEVGKLLPGKVIVVYTLSTDHGFFAWVRQDELKAKTHLTVTASATGSQGMVFKVEVP